MAKSSLQSGSRTVYDAWSGSSKGSFSLEWYDLNDYLSIGVYWGISSSNTSVSIAPKICRWDSAGTDNYGGTFDETLSPDPVGAGSWSGLSWSSSNASGWSGWYDTFNTRTYNRTHANQTVKLTIKSYNLYTYGYGNYGSDTSTFTLTVSPLASYTIQFNANGGSGAPGNQTKWYGETLTLSSTKPTRAGYKFLGWSTSSTATSATWSAGGSYTTNSANTLYAVWARASVTVRYHINGGTLTAQATSGATATVYRQSSSIVQYYNPSAASPAWTTLGSTIKSDVTYANLYNVATFPITKANYHINTTNAWNTATNGSGYSFHQDDVATNTTNKVTTKRLNSGTEITADVTKTLYVNWQPDTYTISYNANGGASAPSSQTKTYGVALTLTSSTPTRTGYAFSKWNTKSDGSGTDYASGASFTTNATTTLYAVWSAYNVTVRYHVNGGTIATNTANATQYKASSSLVYRSTDTGSTWTLSTSSVAASVTYYNLADVGTFPITKTGHHIVASSAWNTATDGSGTSFSQADTADNTSNKVTTKRLNGGTEITGNVTKTLYVKWVPDTYTISYNANGGTGAPASQTKTYGTDLTLTSSTPTRTSYNFSKWNTKSDGTGTNYASGASFTTNAATTLYAVWNPCKIIIRINANGGTITDSGGVHVYDNGTTLYNFRVSSSLIQYRTSTDNGSTFTDWANSGPEVNVEQTYKDLFNVSTYGVTKTGHHIVSTMAYNLKADGTGTNFTENDSSTNTTNNITTTRLNGGTQITADATKTLYMNWKPDEYTVSYAANGGSTTPANQTKYYGTALTLASAISRATASTTYTITFNYNGNGTSNTTTSSVKSTPYTFANWKATDTTTYAAGGSYTKNEATQMTAQWTTGTSSTTTAALPNPSWTGHTLDGWYTVSASTGGTKRGNGGGSYTPTQSETLYARWITNTYAVTYNANGGTSTPATQTKTYGVDLTLASAINKASNVTTYTITYNYNGSGTANTTSTATKTTPYTFSKWKATDNTQYDAGATYTKNEATTLTAQWTTGTTTTTSLTLPTPTWTNHNFVGWYDAAIGGNLVGNAGTSYTPTANKTLYAHWSYTITYNANNGTNAPALHTQAVGENIKIAEGAIRNGYKFSHWCIDANDSGNKYNPGQIYTEQCNLTLYAIWTQIKTISDLENEPVSESKHILSSFIPSIWTAITNKFYGETLYEFTGTIDWSTIRTNPTQNDLNISLSSICTNYKKIIVIGQTYHDTYLTAIILDPCRNKQFILRDNFIVNSANEPSTLYMKNVGWSFASDGQSIIQNGFYGQRWIKQNNENGGQNTYFDIKIIKVIGFKN